MSIDRLTLSPQPGAAKRTHAIASTAALEVRLMMRNGEQLLLTLGIPVILLLGLSTLHFITLGPGPAVNWATPGVMTLAIMSTAFTAQAIATGFDRRSGALTILGSTPLGRSGLLAGKTLAVVFVEIIQFAILVPLAFALGWQPHGDPISVLAYVVIGTAAFSALGIALAGALRAEAVLAVANAIWLVLLLVGGTVIPLDRLPHWLAVIAAGTPSGALGAGLRSVLVHGDSLAGWPILVLTVWTAIGVVVALRTFQWD
jgi:ABC-2 type transport system permease protein